MRPFYLRKFVTFVAASLLLALASPAVAHAEEFAQYSAEQQKLNEQGVRAIISKDYALAVAVLEESTALGELNITYLNLGRAYQKLGDCKAAREAYAKAKTAPKVEAPAPRVVDKKLDEYTAELTAACKEKQTQLADATEPFETNDNSGQQDATVEPVGPRTEAGPPTWAWVATGSGVALMGAGVGSLLWADSLRNEVHDAPRRDGYVTETTRQQALDNASQAQTLDAVGIGMSVGGALLTVAGIYMLVRGDAESDEGLAVSTTRDGLRVVWTQSF
jgi:tetratricopeptide (TPR) repeat protein